MTQKEMIEDMYKILRKGNGEPPLPEQVRNNASEINYVKEKLKNMPLKWRSWITFGVTVLTFVVLLYITYRGVK